MKDQSLRIAQKVVPIFESTILTRRNSSSESQAVTVIITYVLDFLT